MARFEVRRAAVVQAPAARVHALIDDLRQWQHWSPWEGVDPDLERTYTGPATGPGSCYAWSGNRRAGRGSMEITRSTTDRVDLVLTFLKPFRSTSDVSFELTPVATPSGEATTVEWVMTGEQQGMAALFGRFVSMDKLVGGDFEKGLAQLKVAAESPPTG